MKSNTIDDDNNNNNNVKVIDKQKMASREREKSWDTNVRTFTRSVNAHSLVRYR